MSLINSEQLVEFLKNKMDSAEYQKAQSYIDQYLNIASTEFKEDLILEWKESEWITSPLKIDKKSILVQHKDFSYPFSMVLTMIKDTGKPVINVFVKNTFNHIKPVSFKRDIQLNTKKTGCKNISTELSHYWKSGQILKGLKAFASQDEVPFEESIAVLNGQVLTDGDGRKFTRTASKLIAYMYAQIKNRSSHFLTDEPVGWNIPESVRSKISSGLADYLQDQLFLAYETRDCQVSYNKFIKANPDVYKFAQYFVSRY